MADTVDETVTSETVTSETVTDETATEQTDGVQRYRVVHAFVSPSFYHGEIVTEQDFAPDDADRAKAAVERMLRLGAIEPTDEDEVHVIEVDELERSDGDGNAIDADGYNHAPDAPPQKPRRSTGTKTEDIPAERAGSSDQPATKVTEV